MVRLKKIFDLLLATVLCLSLSACGSSDTDTEGAGDDWRNSGVVVGSGTITHTNEGSVVYWLLSVPKAQPSTVIRQNRFCLTAFPSL